jgi:hypothetical protein
MKKVLIGLIISFSLFASLAFAGQETIKDDNDGLMGYILVNTGIQQGNNDVGHWTDITTIPELKGDTGQNGLNGDKGDTGQVGDKGDIGLQGIQGISGLNGKDVDPQELNRLNSKNLEQDNRINNLDSRVGELEKTQYVVRTEVKFIREKYLEVGIYGEYNVGRGVCSEVGLNIVIPIGDSYLDRENKKTNERLARIEAQLEERTIQETKTIETKNADGSTTIQIDHSGELLVINKF